MAYSDGNGGKRRNTKRYFNNNEEYGGPSSEQATVLQQSPVKTPIILAKADKPLSIDTAQPTKLLKAPEPGEVRLATSPKQAGSSSGISASENGQPKYTIHQRTPSSSVKPVHSGNQWTSISQMASSIKLIDEFMHWCGESIVESMLEQTEFRIIGVLGNQGVGKTNVMQLLAKYGQSTGAPDIFSSTTKGAELLGHMTCGLDLYITSERTFLIDCQPLFSSSVIDAIIINERRHTSEFATSESTSDAMALEIVMFLLSVCHIVLVVEDWFTDPTLHRLLHTAEMLRPSPVSSNDKDEIAEYHARIVFVQNKMKSADIHKGSVERMQAVLLNIHKNTLLNYTSVPVDQRVTQVNLLCLPLREQVSCPPLPFSKLLTFSESENPSSRSSLIYDMERKFVQDVLNLPYNSLLTHTSLTEKNWLHYAARMWDAVKKSPFLSEYMRLLH